jgi:hypothetical protein
VGEEENWSEVTYHSALCRSLFGGIMDASTQRELNEAVYRQLKDTIAKTYPRGRFVAIAGGHVVVDAATFRELQALLQERGYHPPEVMVVEAGDTYPEYVTFIGIALGNL